MLDVDPEGVARGGNDIDVREMSLEGEVEGAPCPHKQRLQGPARHVAVDASRTIDDGDLRLDAGSDVERPGRDVHGSREEEKLQSPHIAADCHASQAHNAVCCAHRRDLLLTSSSLLGQTSMSATVQQGRDHSHCHFLGDRVARRQHAGQNLDRRRTCHHRAHLSVSRLMEHDELEAGLGSARGGGQVVVGEHEAGRARV
eukprot:750733-Hanusia_phi.AAC.13